MMVRRDQGDGSEGEKNVASAEARRNDKEGEIDD